MIDNMFDYDNYEFSSDANVMNESEFMWWEHFVNYEIEPERITFEMFLFRVFGAFVCILIILSTLVGNVLVIIVVARFHRMRTVTNILLAR